MKSRLTGQSPRGQARNLPSSRQGQDSSDSLSESLARCARLVVSWLRLCVVGRARSAGASLTQGDRRVAIASAVATVRALTARRSRAFRAIV